MPQKTLLSGHVKRIASLGVAFSGYLFAPLAKWERWWVALVLFLFIAPGLNTMFIGLIAMAPIFWWQIVRSKA
jgi:TRAP-type uncharacterized transport system fused permease subunit